MAEDNQTQTSTSFLNPITLTLTVLVIILAILLGLFVMLVNNIDTLTTPPLIQLFPIGEPPPAPDRSAEQAVESVNLLLGFIEAGSVIIGIAAVGAISAGFLNTRELRQRIDEVEKLRDNINTKFDEINAKFNELNAQVYRFESLAQSTQNLQEKTNSKLDKFAEQIGVFNQSFSQVALAQRQIEMNNLPEALETLENALRLTPDDAFIHYFLGDTQARQGDLKQGRDNLAKARKLAADNGEDFFDADVSYAYALRIQGDKAVDDAIRQTFYTEAKTIFEKVAADRPLLQDISGESAFGALAGLYHRQGDYENAIQWYENARRATPQNTYPLINLALINFLVGNETEALKRFQRVKTLSHNRITLDPYAYWSHFDNITASVGEHVCAMDQNLYPKTEAEQGIIDAVELVYSTARSRASIDKLIEGIQRLLKNDTITETQKDYINSIVTRIEHETAKYKWE